MTIIKNPILLFSPILLISVVFYIPNSGGSTFSLPYNSIALIFLGFAIFVTINSTINRCRNFIFDNFLIVSFLCFIALFIPLIWSESSQYYSALPRLVTIFIGLLLYFSLLQLKHLRYFLKYLLHLICLSVVLSSLFTLYQFYVMSPNSYFAINMEYGRPVGIFQQVNVLASFTATGLATSYYLSLIHI